MTWHYPANSSRKGPVPHIPGPSMQCIAARPPTLWQVATMTARVAASSCPARACAPTRLLGSSASRGVRVRAGTAEKFWVRRLAPGVVASVLLSGLLVGSGTASATGRPQGCHGSATVAYKQATNDPGGQGSASGGQGNSDDNPFNGQAHSAWAVGRPFSNSSLLCMASARRSRKTLRRPRAAGFKLWSALDGLTRDVRGSRTAQLTRVLFVLLIVVESPTNAGANP
jgi:hypothetical protein